MYIMTIRPCEFFTSCDCDSSPYRNFSAEQPDPNTFFRLRFPPTGPPPMGRTSRWYEKESCLGVCFSEVSQEDADACALRDAELCQLPPGPPRPDDPVLYGNAATSCEYACPDGPPFVYSIPANTYLALSQELADLIAQSYCQNLVFEFHVCDMPGPPIPPGTPCPVITGTSPPSPVTLNMGDSVTLSATYTYAGDSSQLQFIWFQGNVPVAFTSGPSFTLTDVDEADEGDYFLGIFAPGCNAVFSPIIQVIVGCVAEVAPPAAPADTGDGTFDYDTLTSRGVFTAMAAVALDGPCTDSAVGANRVYTNCGSFTSGFYNVYINSGGGWHETGETNPGAVPFDEPYALGIGVEMMSAGFPIDVVDEPLDGCFGFAFDVPCPDPTAYMVDHFGQPYPIKIVDLFEHSGGTIRIWGPIKVHNDATETNNAIAPCGGNVQMEIFEHVLAPMPLNIQIDHFATFAASLNMCATCQDRVGVEWDGTLQRITYTPFFLTYQIPLPFNSNTVSLNGKRISTSSCEIILTEDPPGTPVWKLTIKCKNVGQPNGGGTGQIIWSGIKAAGRTPVGVYVSKEEACNPGKNPECCRIIEI